MKAIPSKSGGATTYQVYWDLRRTALPAGVTRKKTSQNFRSELVAYKVNEIGREHNHTVTVERALEILKERHPGTAEADPTPQSEGKTFGEWAEEFIKIKDRKTKWRGKNRHENLRRIQKVILPHFRERPLVEISGDEIDSFLINLRAERKISFATTDDYYQNLGQIFKTAHERGEIPRNPIAFADWEVNQSDEDQEIDQSSERYFEPEQFELFLAHIRADYQPFVQFLLETGTRFGEATALRVRDIDWDRRLVLITRAWEGDYPGLRKNIQLKAPKSGKRRWVEVTDEWLAQVDHRLQGKNPDDFVFLGSRGGRIRNQNFRRDHWNPAMIKIQQCSEHLPTRIDRRSLQPVLDKSKPSSCSCLGDMKWTSYSPHVLRHTFATWLIYMGEDIERVSMLLGHASIEVTRRIYVHQIMRADGRRSSGLITQMRQGRMPNLHRKGRVDVEKA